MHISKHIVTRFVFVPARAGPWRSRSQPVYPHVPQLAPGTRGSLSEAGDTSSLPAMALEATARPTAHMRPMTVTARVGIRISISCLPRERPSLVWR